MLQENGINAELGLACADDTVLDILSERAEKEIVSAGSVEKNLIGPCGPFLSKLCRNIVLMQKVMYCIYVKGLNREFGESKRFQKICEIMIFGNNMSRYM